MLDTCCNFGLKIEPIIRRTEDNWDIVINTDSDYIVYLLGVPICWKSKSQRSVSLSSSETEFISLLEGAKEIKFIVDVKLLVIVWVDNVGEIFMAEYVTTTSGCTKHVNIWYHYVCEFVALIDCTAFGKSKTPITICQIQIGRSGSLNAVRRLSCFIVTVRKLLVQQQQRIITSGSTRITQSLFKRVYTLAYMLHD
jgi:hypothetical protein